MRGEDYFLGWMAAKLVLDAGDGIDRVTGSHRTPHWSATQSSAMAHKVEVLNELAAEGWSVVQVSEDRGIYAGVTNNTDSAVTKARYLLVRER